MFFSPSPQNLGDLFLETLAANLTATEPDENLWPKHEVADVGERLFGHKPADHHIEWLDALEKHHRAIIIAPPESAKTTWTLAALATHIGNHPRLTHAVVSAQAEQATERTAVIKRLIEDESSGWSDLYPHVTPGGKWTDAVLNVNLHPRHKPTPTLFAAGAISGRAIGKRLDGVLLIDDIHDQKNSATPALRGKVVRWVRQTMLSRLTDTARCWVIGTPWATGDTLEELEKIGFVTIRTPAINEDGRSYWPIKWPISELDKKRVEVGKADFDSMYLLKKNKKSRTTFRREWFEILDDHRIPPMVKTVRYWDLAATEEMDNPKAAFTVGALVGIDARRTVYILDIKRFRKSPDGVLRAIDQSAEVDGTQVDIFAEQEPGSSGKTIIDVIRRRLAGYTFKGDKVTDPKLIRAKPLATYAEGGAVKLRRALWNDDFLDEAEDYPDGDYKDQIDAAAGGFRMVAVKGGGLGSTA